MNGPLRSGSSARKWKWVPLLAFVTLSVGIYARILDGWFLSDDNMIGIVIPDGKHVDFGHVLRVFHMDWGERGDSAPLRYYRPLVVLSQAIDSFVWGPNPLGFHLTNVLLHGLNGYLVYRIALSLGGGPGTAPFAGAAFVLYPWHPESVAWISGRTDVLAAVFVFSSLVSHIAARARSGRARVRGLVSTAAFYALALLSKEPSIAVPVMIVAVDLTTGFDYRSPLASLRRVLPAWALLGALSVAYLVFRASMFGNLWGGEAASFYGSRGHTFASLRHDWAENLGLLVSPFNRSTVGKAGHAYVLACVAGGAMLTLSYVLGLRRRRPSLRLAGSSLALFVASVAPFAAGIQIHDDLENARFMYVATGFFCLLLGALAVPSRNEPPSMVLSGGVLALLAFLLNANLTPWVEASDTMRRVTRTYMKTFGAGSGEPIEGLPKRHHGAYMALYNADEMSRAFVPDAPVRPRMVAQMRAVYESWQRDLRIEPDPVYGAVERLAKDRARAEWLYADGASALDAATLENIERTGAHESARSFRATRAASWILLPGAKDLEHVPGAEQFVYLLMRPAPASPPNLFWVSRRKEQFGDPRRVTLEPELTVRDGHVEQRQVDGFFVYAYALHEMRHWPGMERVRTLRLDPHIAEGSFEIGFFGIARYRAPDP